jgi:hypothetical protein
LQWPNISDVATTDTTVATGATLPINFIHDDQSEADTITFFLDTNQNPYDGLGTEIGSQTNVPSSPSISSGTFNDVVGNVAPGTYYLAAEVTDSSGLVRYDYSEKTINVTTEFTVTNAAHSNPPIVTSNATHLLADATDALGGTVTYTWTFTHLPAGAQQPKIYNNGTANSTKVPVTFYKQGGYRFTCTITDSDGHSTTSDGSVDVLDTPTKLEVTPVDATVPKGHARRFSTIVINQFGRAIDPTSLQYSIVSGPATITSTGIFNAGDTTGTALVKVEDETLSEIVDADVIN